MRGDRLHKNLGAPDRVLGVTPTHVDDPVIGTMPEIQQVH
jgi:hypothetical protein